MQGEEGLRGDPVRVRVREADQQLRSCCERHRGLLLMLLLLLLLMMMMTAAAAAPLHRSPGEPPLLDAVRDRNAATGMFVNETARGCFGGEGIMMQPCRS